jgi:uncharacterized protein (DUF1697 family)
MAGREIALLRGINVGKAKRVAMADLAALVERLGYKEVKTLLNSGNVVFTVPAAVKGKAAARIEEALATKLKLQSRVTGLTAAELDDIVEGNPLLEVATDHSRLFVTVITDPADRALLVPLTKEKWSPDVLALGQRVAYQWCVKGSIDSPLSQAVGKVMKARATTRNWATILKLQQLAAGPR